MLRKSNDDTIGFLTLVYILGEERSNFDNCMDKKVECIWE